MCLFFQLKVKRQRQLSSEITNSKAVYGEVFLKIFHSQAALIFHHGCTLSFSGEKRVMDVLRAAHLSGESRTCSPLCGASRPPGARSDGNCW